MQTGVVIVGEGRSKLLSYISKEEAIKKRDQHFSQNKHWSFPRVR